MFGGMLRSKEMSNNPTREYMVVNPILLHVSIFMMVSNMINPWAEQCKDRRA